MNAVQDFLTSLPQIRTALDILLLTVPPAVLTAFSGLGLLCAALHIRGVRQRRSSFGRCARQMTTLSLILGWTLLAASRLWLYFRPAEDAAAALGTVHEIAWMLLAAAVLFAGISLAAWNALGRIPILHVCVELCQALCGHLAFLVMLAAEPLAPVVAALSAPAAGGMAAPAIDNFLPLTTPILCSFALLFAMPASFGACWLLLRRRHDDYGRDHYNAMLHWCAGWARASWLALWILLAVLGFADLLGGGAFTGWDVLLQGLFLLFWLVPALLWVAARAGSAPLRHKAGLTAAMLLSVAFFLPLSLAARPPLPNDVAFLPEKDAVLLPAPDMETPDGPETADGGASSAPEDQAASAAVPPDIVAPAPAPARDVAAESAPAPASAEAAPPAPASPAVAEGSPAAPETPQAAGTPGSSVVPAVAGAAAVGAAAGALAASPKPEPPKAAPSPDPAPGAAKSASSGTTRRAASGKAAPSGKAAKKAPAPRKAAQSGRAAKKGGRR